jgi:hypothetical protein
MRLAWFYLGNATCSARPIAEARPTKERGGRFETKDLDGGINIVAGGFGYRRHFRLDKLQPNRH